MNWNDGYIFSQSLNLPLVLVVLSLFGNNLVLLFAFDQFLFFLLKTAYLMQKVDLNIFQKFIYELIFLSLNHFCHQYI